MTDEEKIVGRIKAVVSASDEVIRRALPLKQRDTILIAKETAYDHIKAIIEGIVPWQE